jgi:hypothetical protein
VLSFGIHTLFEAGKYIPATIDVRMMTVKFRSQCIRSDCVGERIIGQLSQQHDHASVGQWSVSALAFCLGEVASTGVEATIFADTI